MLDYAHLKALSVVIAEGGFERAAKALFITQSAVSQRIKSLEEKVGQTLLIRSNPVQATPMGKRLLRHYAQVSLLESELSAEIDADDPTLPTVVKVAVNADSLATWFLPALAELFKRHRWILELIVDDESYTHHLLKSGDAVGCVTTTEAPLVGCSSEYLGQMEYLCVATQEFVDHYFSKGLSPDSLLQAPAVVFSTKDKLHEKFLGQFYGIEPERWREHQIPSSESFLDAILLGMGYGLVGHLQARALIETGQLVLIAPRYTMKVPLFWQHWNIKAKQTTLVYRALAATAKQALK